MYKYLCKIYVYIFTHIAVLCIYKLVLEPLNPRASSLNLPFLLFHAMLHGVMPDAHMRQVFIMAW